MHKYAADKTGENARPVSSHIYNYLVRGNTFKANKLGISMHRSLTVQKQNAKTFAYLEIRKTAT